MFSHLTLPKIVSVKIATGQEKFRRIKPNSL
jgi:hypothetical protein